MTVPGFIKNSAQFAFQKVIQLCLALHGNNYFYAFILGHMRSGSTLLTHIIASNPNFVSAGETHVTYRTSADLSRLAVITCQRLRRLKLTATYVVDQINHNYVSDETFSSPLIRNFVILIRAPDATLKSMISTFHWDQQVALECYVDRLSELEKCGEILKEKALLVEYDDLIDRTEETLAVLTEYFHVTPPFKKNYAMLGTTGRFGDPSSNIRVGSIVRTQSHTVPIDPQILIQASVAFNQCRKRLLSAGVVAANMLRPISHNTLELQCPSR